MHFHHHQQENSNHKYAEICCCSSRAHLNAFLIGTFLLIVIETYLKNVSHFVSASMYLTNWGWVTHICVSKLTIFGSDNGLSPGLHQVIIWSNVAISLIWPPGTRFSGMLIKILMFSFKKMHLNMLSVKCQPFCLSLNVFTLAQLPPLPLVDCST